METLWSVLAYFDFNFFSRSYYLISKNTSVYTVFVNFILVVVVVCLRSFAQIIFVIVEHIWTTTLRRRADRDASPY